MDTEHPHIRLALENDHVTIDRDSLARFMRPPYNVDDEEIIADVERDLTAQTLFQSVRHDIHLISAMPNSKEKDDKITKTEHLIEQAEQIHLISLHQKLSLKLLLETGRES